MLTKLTEKLPVTHTHPQPTVGHELKQIILHTNRPRCGFVCTGSPGSNDVLEVNWIRFSSERVNTTGGAYPTPVISSCLNA